MQWVRLVFGAPFILIGGVGMCVFGIIHQLGLSIRGRDFIAAAAAEADLDDDERQLFTAEKALY
jgi:hypothetical protein